MFRRIAVTIAAVATTLAFAAPATAAEAAPGYGYYGTPRTAPAPPADNGKPVVSTLRSSWS